MVGIDRWSRFQQARRHSQGIAELGYVLLQYVRLMSTGFSRLSIRAHRGILSIAAKMFIIHIFNSVQAFSVEVTVSMVIPRILAWVWSGGLSVAAESLDGSGYRSDHRRRILKRGQVVVFCSFRTDCATGFSHRCDSVSGDQRCVGGPLHERCDRADEGLH